MKYSKYNNKFKVEENFSIESIRIADFEHQYASLKDGI